MSYIKKIARQNQRRESPGRKLDVAQMHRLHERVLELLDMAQTSDEDLEMKHLPNFSPIKAAVYQSFAQELFGLSSFIAERLKTGFFPPKHEITFLPETVNELERRLEHMPPPRTLERIENDIAYKMCVVGSEEFVFREARKLEHNIAQQIIRELPQLLAPTAQERFGNCSAMSIL